MDIVQANSPGGCVTSSDAARAKDVFDDLVKEDRDEAKHVAALVLVLDPSREWEPLPPDWRGW